jgi:hypothetical protein
MGIFDNVGQVAETLGQDPDSAGANSFKRDFNINNFDSWGGDVTAGKYTEIGRFRIPSSTEYSWGYGSANAPTNQGYLYADLYDDAGNEVEGTIRFTIQSATGRQEIVVADFDTEKLDASKSNREQQVPFPEQVSTPKASEDSYLVVKFDPASNVTLDDGSNSEVILPVTEYDLS